MKPIGVFDSGVGGLTVVAALNQALPQVPILYLGDTARLPYGTKSPATVARYTRRNIDFLLERDVQAVVVACNTASALALPDLQAPVPLWGVIDPGAHLAAELSQGHVGVIATESTVRSGAYESALRRARSDLQITSQACPLFVPLVEEGWSDDEVTSQIASRYLNPLVEAGVDTLVLGCTHYPLLKPVLQRTVGDGVRLVDSADAVAQQVGQKLQVEGSSDGRNGDHFCVTDDSERFSRIAGEILQVSDPSLELVDVSG